MNGQYNLRPRTSVNQTVRTGTATGREVPAAPRIARKTIRRVPDEIADEGENRGEKRARIADIDLSSPTRTTTTTTVVTSTSTAPVDTDEVSELRKGTRIQRYVLTLNNYTDEELDKIKMALNENHCNWAVVAKEVGKCGTPHLQGGYYVWDKVILNISFWVKGYEDILSIIFNVSEELVKINYFDSFFFDKQRAREFRFKSVRDKDEVMFDRAVEWANESN